MSEWREFKIGDIADVFDGPHATPKKVNHGPWFLSISSLRDGRLVLSESAHVTEEDFTKWTRRVTPQEGDVLFSYETRLGEAALMPKGIRACLGRRMGLLRPKRESVDPHFLLLSYLSPRFQATIHSRKIPGATVDRIPLVNLPSWPIHLPPLPEQQAIASALGALDDKIAVNERISDTSRQLGVVLYKEATDSESRSTTVEDSSSYLNRGQAPKYTEDEDGMTVLNQRCVRAGRVQLDPARRTLAARVQEARKLKHGDVLVNSTGVGTLGRVSLWSHDIEATVDSHVTIVRINPEVTPTIIGGFAMLAAQRRIEALGEGSTGQTELSKAKLGQLEIDIPSGETDKLADRLTSLEQKADAALAESRTLAELRDTLLPQLMSGKLRVKDAEKIVEDNV